MTSHAGFAVEYAGRVVSLDSPGENLAATVRLDPDRVAIEVNLRALSAAAVAILCHWLLTMQDDDRPFDVVETGLMRLSPPRDAAGVMMFLDSLMVSLSIRPSHFVGPLAMIAGPGGVTHLDEHLKERLGFLDCSDQDAAIDLVKSGDRIAFLPEARRLTVVAKAAASVRVLAHARAWLAAQGGGPIRLRVWLEHGWINEMAPSGPAAAKRLWELTELDRLEAPLPAYIGRRIRVEEMAENDSRFFAPLLTLSGTDFDSRAFTTLLDCGFGDRLFLTGVHDGLGRYILHAQGLDYTGPLWKSMAPGQRLIDQPDRDYGLSVNARMADAANGNAPHVEQVQCGIRESDDDLKLGDTRLSRYFRVAVPCRFGDETVVVSYSRQRRWDAVAPLTA